MVGYVADSRYFCLFVEKFKSADQRLQLEYSS